MSKRFKSGLLFGGDSYEQWLHLPRVSLCFGYRTSPSSAWNASLLWGSGCDLTTASVITCCDCQISAPEIRALRPALKQTQWKGGGGGAWRGLLSVTLHKAATPSTRLIGLQSQLHHYCKESTRSPTHSKTTVRWYSQPATPWELAASCASGDQRAGNRICFPPKLLIIEVTLMWRGHFSQVTLVHLLAPCFVFICWRPLVFSLFVQRWRDVISLVL